MIGTTSSSTMFTILIAFVLALVFSSTQVSAQEGRPIFMNRREAAPIGDILSELKGKGLGGRMRFGKRSSGMSLGAYRSIYEPQYDFVSL